MAIDYLKEGDGIVLLTMDMPGRSANVLNEEFFTAYEAVLERLESDEGVTGAILVSGKRLWVAGADIDTSFNSEDPAYFFEMAERLKAQFRRLETLGKPVVAALNGTALGGGMELALACHYRIAIDDDRIQFGFPEVGLGLLPGAGGVARTVRLAGLQIGLEWLSHNRKYSPRQALKAGMVHALAADFEEMMSRARAWVRENADAQAPWDRGRNVRIPGGGPQSPHIAQMLAIAPAMIRQETRGNYPAPIAILSAMVEGAQVDFETACRIESRYFARLAAGQVSRNMIEVFWRQLNRVRKGMARPDGFPRQNFERVGVLGAGMMGHGIGYVTAAAGLEVVMVDTDGAKADTGMAKIQSIVDARVRRGRMTEADGKALLARIRATDDYDHLEGCDLVIEAVFEDRAVKAEVTRRAEERMDPGGVFASNTSSLPISGLAQESKRPQKFVGLHFFSPVEKMQLVEIIVGDETDDETLARAFDFVQSLRKIPIVVNDSRAFYTSRVVGAWTNEGMALLAEGQHPQAIEMAAMQAGMPMGPLALLDEVSLKLVDSVRSQALVDGDRSGRVAVEHPGYRVLDWMLGQGRGGRAEGAGFYDYGEDEKRLWPGLVEHFVTDGEPLSQAEMIDRFLYIQSVETLRCLQEGVLRSVEEANIGAIFGWGYPGFHGGPLQFVQAVGEEQFEARARELAERYGERFAPPQVVRA